MGSLLGVVASVRRPFFSFLCAATLAGLAASAASAAEAQTSSGSMPQQQTGAAPTTTQSTTPSQAPVTTQTTPPTIAEPKIKDYQGVTIGMDAAEVRSKLGNKNAKGKTDDFFRISDKEMAQVYYDAKGKVRAIVVTYVGKDSGAPDAEDVLGEDLTPGSNGRVQKLVRYPQAGYWVAYGRSAGDSPVVTVTMQRMRTAAAAPSSSQQVKKQ